MKASVRTVSLGVVSLVLVSCSPKSYTLIPEKRAQIKTVAIFSVYGPEKLHAGFGSFAQQEIFDYLEERLPTALQENGLNAVPVGQRKLLVATEYEDTFLEFLAPEHKAQIKAANYNKEEVKKLMNSLAALARAFQTQEVASSNTCLCLDYYSAQAKGNRLKFSDAFRKTLGKLTQKLNADAFLLVRVQTSISAEKVPESPGPLALFTRMAKGDRAYSKLTMGLFDTGGEVIFEDEVIGQSKEGMGIGGLNLRYDAKDIGKTARQAQDQALEALSKHMSGKK